MPSLFNLLISVFLLIQVLMVSTGTVEAQASTDNYFRVFYANDFFRARDLYYTQGLRLELARGKWAFLFTREGFTPSSLADPEIRIGDHPYAGVSYAGVRRTWTGVSDGAADVFFLQGFLGIIGPASGGKQEQTAIHRWIDDEIPMGWGNQIANDLIMDMMVGYDRSILNTRFLDIELGGLARLGTYRTRLDAHGQIRIGIVKPISTRKGKSFSLVYRVTPVAQLVGYDATLQGGLFNGSSPYKVPAEDVARAVGRLHTSLDMRFGGFGASFGHTYQTRRFATIDAHAWGELTLVWYGRKTGKIVRGDIMVN